MRDPLVFPTEPERSRRPYREEVAELLGVRVEDIAELRLSTSGRDRIEVELRPGWAFVHCRTGKNGWGQKDGMACWNPWQARYCRRVYMRYRCTPAVEPFCLHDRSQLPANLLWERYLRAGSSP